MIQLDLLYRLVISKFYYLIVPLFFLLNYVHYQLPDWLQFLGTLETSSKKIYADAMDSFMTAKPRYSGDFKSSFWEASWRKEGGWQFEGDAYKIPIYG